MARGCDAWGLFMYSLALAQIGISLSLIIVVKEKLWNFNLSLSNPFNSVTSGDYECMLSYNGINICAYIYVVCAGSIVLSVFIFFTTCFGKRIWLGLQALILAFGVIWWTPAAVTATVYGVRANHRDIPEKAARTATWSLCWAELGLFVVALLATLWDCYRPRKVGRIEEEHYMPGAYKRTSMADPLEQPLAGAQYAQEAPAPGTASATAGKPIEV